MDKFSTGCQVIINEERIQYIHNEDPEQNRKTIDIAGCNNLKAIFYELKVGPEGFGSNVIKYLNILFNKAHEYQISEDITIGCITLKSKTNLLSKLDMNGENYVHLQVNGIRELKEFFS